MLPPLLYLVLLFGLLLCFPLGVFPLPVFALKERLNFREQNAGKGLYLVIGNPRAVVIGFLSARHGIPPLKLPLVEQSGRSCWRKSKISCPLSHGRAGRLESILSLPRRGRTQRSSPARYATTWISGFAAGRTACFLKLFSTTPAPPNRYPRMHGAASSQEMARCFKALVIGSGLAIHSQYLSKNSPMPRRSLIFP